MGLKTPATIDILSRLEPGSLVVSFVVETTAPGFVPAVAEGALSSLSERIRTLCVTAQRDVNQDKISENDPRSDNPNRDAAVVTTYHLSRSRSRMRRRDTA